MQNSLMKNYKIAMLIYSEYWFENIKLISQKYYKLFIFHSILKSNFEECVSAIYGKLKFL